VCGSPVPNRLGSVDAFWVPVGLLDESARLEVVADLHLSSRASWDRAETPCACYQEFPGVEEFYALVRNQ
jgi:hypothetical protein